MNILKSQTKIRNFCKFCCLRSVLLTLFHYRYILVIFDKYWAIPTRYLSCWQGANENRCEFCKMLMALKLVEISIVIVGSQLYCVAFLPFQSIRKYVRLRFTIYIVHLGGEKRELEWHK